MVKRTRFFEERVVVFLHQTPDANRVLDIIGTVRIGVQCEVGTEHFPHLADQCLATSFARIHVIGHAATQTELKCFAASFFGKFLEMLNFVLHRVATIAAGPVDRYSFPLHTAEHFSKRLPRELPQQVKNRHLCCRVRSPQADALKLVVAATAIKFGEQQFQMAGIFALEERCDPAQEHGIKFAHPSAIGDSNSFVSLVGADSCQIGRTVLQQFNRSDRNGLVESVELQDWAACDFGKLILHRVSRFDSINIPASR